MPQNPTKRLRYFDHQFLRADDFTAEQEYHLWRRRLHNRALHTWGIAEGLAVTFDTGGFSVTVQQGTAIDSEGREIVLTEDRRLDLSDQPSDAAVYITIEYAETPTDLSKETDIQDNTRWTEKPDVKALSARPADPSRQIIVGKVSRTGTVVSGVDDADRRAAGAVSGDITTSALTLKRDGVDPAKWPKLTCAGASQAALGNASLKIDANKEIYFQDGGQLRSFDDSHRLVFNRAGNRLEFYELGDIAFLTGSPQAERLKIQANGNVGIGTMNPLGKLAIDTGGGALTSLKCEHRGSTFIVRPSGAGETSTVIENTGGGHLLINPSGGNVGIGSNNPAAGLEINKGATNNLALLLTSSGSGWGSGLQLKNTTPSTGTTYGIYSGSDGKLHVTDPVAGVDRLVLDSSGNVGIGTAAPSYGLHAASGKSVRYEMGAGSKFSMGGSGTFEIDAPSVVGGRLFIADNGNVGIGTAAPTTKLDVNGTLAANYLQVNPQNSENEGGEIRLRGSGKNPDWHLDVYYDHFRMISKSNDGSKVKEILNMNAEGGMTVYGNLTVTGSKGGYVTDMFVNNLGETLEQGDVVVLGSNQASLYYGKNNGIPVFEVDLTDTAYDRRVCGIVCEVHKQSGLEFVEMKGGSVKPQKAKAAGKSAKAAATKSRDAAAAESAAGADETRVESGQMGLVVTLGSFAYCKVDADIAPVEVGDLLTTSPTRGHAQKVIEHDGCAGAILGKALGRLKKGKAKIPVLVMLQ